jgi:hypothetical protein
MAGKTVIIGCRLPHGVVLRHPVKQDATVELKGLNSATIIGTEHVTTEIDAQFWADWKAANANSDLTKSNAVFEAKSLSDAAAIAREISDETTGLEPLRTDGKDKRAKGVKKADNKDPE